MIFLSKKIPQHLCVASFGWICRIINASIQVVSIPVILRFLGTSDYAIFAIITGLLTWYNLADIGLGSSIQNEISYLRVNGDDGKEFLRSIAIYIVIIGIIEVAFFLIAALFLQHLLLRQISTTAPRYLLAMVGSMYIVVTVFGISARIFFAKQKGYWGYLYQSVGIVIGFTVILLMIFLQVQNKLFWIAFGWMVPQVIISIISFLHAVPCARWIKSADFKVFRKILATAWQFSVYAISAAFVLGLDYIIMSQIISVNEIVIYNIFNKIFAFIFFGYTAVLAAIWPVMTENYVSGNELKIRATNKTIVRNIWLGVTYVLLASIVVIVAKGSLMRYFADAKLTVPALIIALFGIYYAIRVWSETYTTAILSRNKVAFVVTVLPLQAVISVVFSYYFGMKFGLAGILAGLILCFVLTSFWLMPVYHYYLLGYFKKINHRSRLL